MVALKTSLALPSLSKSSSSRSASPAPSPVPSEQGQKRSMLDALPKARSKSGEAKQRGAGHGHAHAGTVPAPITSTLSPVPSSSGNGATSALKPRLSALLSGRSTPHAAPLPSPGLSAATPQINGGTPAPTPAVGHAAVTPNANGPSVAISTLEASYVTKIGMGLNDAVNKVFPSGANGFVNGAAPAGALPGAVMHDAALVTYKGLCAPRVDRAREVGQMIASELHLAINDQYLLRSLLRSAVLKTLSIFLSRLESLIISPTSDPTVLTVPRSIKEAENPPVSQKYSFMILRSAWELKKGLLKACSSSVDAGGKQEEMPRFVKDTLAPWVNKLDLLANRIWNPILNAIKEEAVKTVVVSGAQEAHVTPPSTSTVLPGPPSNGRSMSLNRSTTAHTAVQMLGGVTATASAAAATNLVIPPYLRDLGALLAATSRTFAWLSVADMDHQKWKVQIGSLVTWKMLLMISSKRVEGFGGTVVQRRVSPPGTAGGSDGSGTERSRAGATVAAPPLAKRSMSAMGIARLRPSTSASGRRSPSPPKVDSEAALSVQSCKLVSEVEIFESIMEKFVASLLPSPSSTWDGHSIDLSAGDKANSAPCSRKKDCPVCKGRFIPLDLDDSDDDDEEALPREAMQEAMTALSSFIVILRAFAVDPSPVSTLLKAITAVDDISLSPEICPNLIRALDTIPPLILLQEIVSRIPRYYGFRFPHELWSTTWRDFENTMKGFHTGEEWVGEIGWELLKEASRVRERLVQQDGGGGGEPVVDEFGWLQLLRDAVTDLAEVDDLDDGSASGSGIASAEH